MTKMLQFSILRYNILWFVVAFFVAYTPLMYLFRWILNVISESKEEYTRKNFFIAVILYTALICFQQMHVKSFDLATESFLLLAPLIYIYRKKIKLTALLAGFFLFLTPFFLWTGFDALAEMASILVFYFLIIVTIQNLYYE